MLYYKKNEKHLAAWGLIGGHVVGFTALDAFYPLYLIEPFNGSPGVGLVVIMVAISALFVLCFVGHQARAMLIRMERAAHVKAAAALAFVGDKSKNVHDVINLGGRKKALGLGAVHGAWSKAVRATVGSTVGSGIVRGT